MQHKVQTYNTLYNNIKILLQNAKNKVYATINSTMTETYLKSETASRKFKLGYIK